MSGEVDGAFVRHARVDVALVKAVYTDVKTVYTRAKNLYTRAKILRTRAKSLYTHAKVLYRLVNGLYRRAKVPYIHAKSLRMYVNIHYMTEVKDCEKGKKARMCVSRAVVGDKGLAL
jgi:hypothetical protein